MIDPAKTAIRNNTMIKRYVQTARNIRIRSGNCSYIYCKDCPIFGYQIQEHKDNCSDIYFPKYSKYSSNRNKAIFVKEFLKRYDPLFENSLKKNKE